ncbi:MAG TPA: hypothetical protein VHE55_12620 [Fimbriimonadaceae bacterium]|nr:hypothetical protein [Fimbriimonadaceae bacterium]
MWKTGSSETAWSNVCPDEEEDVILCKVRVSVEKAIMPKERLAIIKTTKGREEVVVSERSLEGNSLKARLITEESTSCLIELPRETSSGAWRVWVPKEEVLA